jgi:autoinducer 2-degrading protein
MYVVTVEFTIRPDNLEPFRQAMRDQAKNSIDREPECHLFNVSYDLQEPTTCFLYEVYSDKAAFEAHLDTGHFIDFNNLVTPWVIAKTVKTYQRDWPT